MKGTWTDIDFLTRGEQYGSVEVRFLTETLIPKYSSANANTKILFFSHTFDEVGVKVKIPNVPLELAI